MSDDGRNGLTLIAFIGSVFSPYYRRARRTGGGDPCDHVAVNVALYGKSRRWSMTERGRSALARDGHRLRIGSSELHWDGQTLIIGVRETCSPLPSRLAGRIRVEPVIACDRTFLLDQAGRHRWSPHFPRARVSLDFERPSLRWKGEGYLDSNFGDCPLEDSFRCWDWSRGAVGAQTCVLYDVEEQSGSERSLALRFDRSGGLSTIVSPTPTGLPPTRWRLARRTRSEDRAEVLSTLEDTPFYARSLVRTQLLGAQVTSVHESLSLDRFVSPLVQFMLPFRMPRALVGG